VAVGIGYLGRCALNSAGRLPALCVLDQRSCWTPSDGAAAIPRFAHSPRADTEILRSLVIVGLVSARAQRPACRAVKGYCCVAPSERTRIKSCALGSLGHNHAHIPGITRIFRWRPPGSRGFADRPPRVPLSHTNTPLQPLPKMRAAYPRPIGSRVYGLAHSALYPIQPDARYTLAATSRGRLCCGT
jgi:hypothetical protein